MAVRASLIHQTLGPEGSAACGKRPEGMSLFGDLVEPACEAQVHYQLPNLESLVRRDLPLMDGDPSQEDV